MASMILVAVGVTLLMTSSALAQSYCDQVRQAVAIYGHAASKQHALEHYGKEAVEAGERCLREGKYREGRIKAIDDASRTSDGSRRRQRINANGR